VINDIRFYGLLKTIGTTKKQIRRLISHQAVFLSVIGIPIGLLIGFLIGKATLPIAMSIGDATNIDTSLEFNPFIMVFGAVFSAFTVFLSCRKPGKIAGNVSPIEAVKYTDADFTKRYKKRKRSSRFSAVSMALSNLGRNKRTTVVVTAAISLSIILLAIIMTAVRSFRLDQYIEQRIVGDFLIGNVNVTNMSPMTGDASIDEEYLSLADSQEGIESINKMWVQYATFIKIDENAAKAFRKLDEEGKLRHGENDNVDGRLTGEDSIDGYAYKYDTALFDNLKVIEGSLDAEKFQNGKYILLGTMRGDDSITEHDHVYHPGDKVVVESLSEDSTFYEIKNEAGETIGIKYENLANDEYEVMAIVDIPASMNLHRYPMNACDFILPLPTPAVNSECFAVSYQISDEYQDDFENAVKYYSENVNTFMGYMSKDSIANEFNSMLFAITSIGIALAATIALIGILNFINAMITEIIARKREFAMLQSIGMTNAQLQKTLICEGIAYIAISAGVSFVLGSLLSWKVLEALNNVFLFFEYRFQLLPFIITIPILLLVAVLAPLLSFKQLKKKSIVERLRESE
ncbi:MAG: FtsX-like permease family protein, partial [Lachnospiraceae bacterium]|nr:FtsX-like permease family protein [Lachnospiraceae bacterium]